MKTEIVEWFDDLAEDAWVLAEKEYGVSLTPVERHEDGEAILAVRGEDGRVDEFVSDVEDGEVRPLCEMQRAAKSDEEYAAAAAEAALKIRKRKKA